MGTRVFRHSASVVTKPMKACRYLTKVQVVAVR